MSRWEKTKVIGPLVVFNILLPTWDVFSDVKLTVDLIRGGHQSCFREEENVQEFRQEIELCLENPEEYCQSNSAVKYLCPTKSDCLSCENDYLFENNFCQNSQSGVREIYSQCLKNNSKLTEHEYYDYEYHYNESNVSYINYDYCTDPNTYHGICGKGIRRHYKFAFLLFGKDTFKQFSNLYTEENIISVPCFICYCVSFLQWYRKETEKIKTVCFPLFGIYPQLGKILLFIRS